MLTSIARTSSQADLRYDTMTPLAIDTDPGIDDALALLLAFGSADCAVEVVTTVAGNVSVDIATRNARRLIALAAPRRTPRVVEGAARPLRRRLRTAVHYHGPDGLGGAPIDAPVAAKAPVAADAPAVIVETARRLGGMLTLVALGPLTNLALALELDAPAVAGVGAVVAMGGAVDVPGNITPAAEFNFHVDPEAATRVVAAALPLCLVPLDVTERVVLRSAALAEAMARARRPVAAFVLAAVAHAIAVGGGDAMPLHDPLALGVALDATFVRLVPMRLAIGPDGETRREQGVPNCRVAVDVDGDRFVGWFLERLCRASS
jgi:inosine-uridine nucleoside N-ribohydrolase